MRKSLTAALAALTFGGAVAATAAPAEARPYGGRYYSHRYYGHHGNDAGVAVAAGVVGLALGAALASNSGRHGYYDRGYYSRSYYPTYGYGYYEPDYGYYGRTCESRRRTYDDYTGREVTVTRRYAC
jgi:hypothetical protein